MPLGLALVALTATACTPPAMDEPDAEQSTDAASDKPLDIPLVPISDLQRNLRRLAEPSLAENCSEEFTSYRFLRLGIDQHVAAVRVSWDADRPAYEAAHRSVFSSSPEMAVSLDGHVDERMWNRIEAEMGYADFWNLESDGKVSGSSESSFFLEACKNGEYHWVQRRLRDTWLARIVKIFTLVGKLEWLETGK